MRHDSRQSNPKTGALAFGKVVVMRESSVRSQRLRLLAIAGLACPLVACGGGAKPLATPSRSKAATARASEGALSPPPSGLPPLAVMPPPGVAGSKNAKPKPTVQLFACGGGAKPHAPDPAALVKRLGEACAASKMTAVGALIRGTQADRDAHQEHKVRVDANACYRVVFATDENISDAAVVMRDSAGDVVAESSGAALPEDGVVCFTSSDDVTLLIGIGAGKGSYAAQVWRE